MVLRHYSRIRTIGCLLPLETCMIPSGIMRVLRKEAFRSVRDLGFWALGLKRLVSSKTSTSGE